MIPSSLCITNPGYSLWSWHSAIVGVTSIALGCSQFIAGIIRIWYVSRLGLAMKSCWQIDRQPETDTSVYVQYGIFVGICLLYGIINSVAVKFNGLINQAACKLLAVLMQLLGRWLIAHTIVYINMLGILFIVIVGLALTKPLNTGSFVVSYHHSPIALHVHSHYRYVCSLVNSTMALVLVTMDMPSFLSSSNHSIHFLVMMALLIWLKVCMSKGSNGWSLSNTQIFRNQKLATWLAIWYSDSSTSQCYYRISVFGCCELYGQRLWRPNPQR